MAHNKVLTLNERISIVKLYLKNNENASEVCRQFRQLHIGNSVTAATVIRINKNFTDTGSVADLPRTGRPKTGRSEDNVERVRDAIAQAPTTSTRRLSAELGIKRTSVYRILKKDLKFKSTIPVLCQFLNEDDFDRRLQFAEWYAEMADNDPDFPGKILWSDEACFKVNGHVNRHNSIYWSANNPHRLMPVAQQGPGVMVWCGILDNTIIGPYFFDKGTVNGEQYLRMLETYLWPAVCGRQDIFFQQDGAQPHYALTVRAFLDEKFGDRWIGRRGPVDWPPRSPDLTPPDFWLWGFLKEQVYSRRPQNVTHLRALITEAINAIPQDVIKNVTGSVPARYATLVEKEGKQLP